MGLDTYAVDPETGSLDEEQKRAFDRAHISLVGGMFSGDGSSGSFRGKVYSQIVFAATGVDLYTEEISAEKVYEMPADIKRAIDDLVELEKFFRVCKEQGLGLYNWC